MKKHEYAQGTKKNSQENTLARGDRVVAALLHMSSFEGRVNPSL